MTNHTTIEALVERIETVHTHFADVLAQIREEQLEEPRLADGRSGKDMLAHLTFWDKRLLHAIAPQGGPNVSRLTPPLIADIPYDDQWLDTVNERIFNLNRDRDIATIKDEFARTCIELRQTVSALTEHDVFDPDGLSALLGEPFAQMVIGAHEHYEDHIADLRVIVGG